MYQLYEIQKPFISNKMKEKIPTLRTKKYDKNPFVFELKKKMFLQPRANTIIAKGETIFNSETGEVLKESVLIGRRKIVDKSQFAKIYANEIGILYELNKAGQNVFLYLLKVMNYENEAYFNYNTDYKQIKIDKKRVYKTGRVCQNGLKELLARDIIARSHKPHHYWINPAIACKGERFAKYTEYIVKEDDAYNTPKNAIRASNQRFSNKVGESTKEKFKRGSNQISRSSENRLNWEEAEQHPDAQKLID